MNRRAFGLLILGGSAAALTGCSQTYSECAEDYRENYRAKHGVPPTEQQVRDACSTTNRRRTSTVYGTGSRGSRRGGGTSSGK
ncbi:hypothetical protein [Mariniluteicoccus flavus]